MSEDFKVLDDRSHTILRPDLYIGSTTEEIVSGVFDYKYQTKRIVPGLIKIIEESINNSIDEWVRCNGEYANEISLTIEHTIGGTEITLTDNGRGIPVEIIKIDGVDKSEYRPVLAWTALRAGSNFDDTKGRVTSGKNGVGISLTNIFSTSFIGITDDGKKRLTLNSKDNMSVVTHKVSKSVKRGTTVKFIPDLSKFGINEFTQDHIDVIQDQLHNLAILFPNIQFSFNSEKIKFKNFKQVAKNFHENAIYYQEENIQLVFAPSGSNEEFILHSYVNGINTKLGGTHVDFIVDKIIVTLREYINKKHKINVLPAQIKQHLLFASWITKMPNCKFDSQTKARITNTIGEVSAYLKDIDFDKISRQILNTPEIIDPIISAILYKKEREEAAELAKKQKSISKKRVVGHIVANDPNPENRMLLLCEGQCIHQDTKVFTIDGDKPIKDIDIGDLVMTHNHKMRKVISKSFSLKHGIKVNGVIYSPEHKLYVYDTTNNTFSFMSVKDIDKTIHKLVHNRLIENGFYNGLHIVVDIKKNNTVITNRTTIQFSDSHNILSFDGDTVSTKLVNDVLVGDILIL